MPDAHEPLPPSATPPSPPSPDAASEASTIGPESVDVSSLSQPLGAAPETAPAAPPVRRRRFDPAPEASGKLPASVWRRHWWGVGGFALLASCMYALIGSPWPAWRWAATPLPERPLPGGAVAVVIDPGHGGRRFRRSLARRRRKDLNLDVGRRVAQNSRARGPGAAHPGGRSFHHDWRSASASATPNPARCS